MTDGELKAALREAAYLEGDFVLRSGKRSRYYLDKYRFETRPDILAALGERIAQRVREFEPDAVRLAGPELGAVALAAAGSLASGLPFLIVRKAAKEYGTSNRVEGAFDEGECVCLVEDVVTSGGALLEAVSGAPRRRFDGADGRLRCRPRGGRGGRLGAPGRAATADFPCERGSRGRQKTRKTAWLSQSDLAVRVFSRDPNRRQEERDLTKQEFVNEVANKSGLSSRDAARAVDAFLEGITDTLKGGGEVAFTGFGKFTTQRRAERQGVNPRNPSQKVTIPAATVPKFTAGSQLKAAVKGGAG